ncbi:MAG TPA: SRPBCC domain-containing protein [Chitinophagaceae bacterium]|nr:SRPBCC domain-containing protein [Chitinophagaceae bacterium]
MATQPLEIKASIKILKPPHEVFEAIVDPQKMSGYFISESTGRMESNTSLVWKFPELDMEFPVRVLKVEPTFISFTWNDVDGTETTTEITLKPMPANETLVSIIEKGRNNDEEGINWLRRNTEGWANFLACLKAYLEYGINLRKGAFDLSQMPEFHQ